MRRSAEGVRTRRLRPPALPAVLASTLSAACAAPDVPADPAVGTWRLAVVCLYERLDGPPCAAVEADSAEVLTLEPNLRFTRRRPDEAGTYRLERRSTPTGAEELLIRFDGGAPAQLLSRGDTLVVSWAYVDGAEKRYVRRR